MGVFGVKLLVQGRVLKAWKDLTDWKRQQIDGATTTVVLEGEMMGRVNLGGDHI